MKISDVFELPVDPEQGFDEFYGVGVDKIELLGHHAHAAAQAINTHDRMKELLQQAAGRVVISQASTEELEWLADTIDVLGGDI